MYIRNKTKTLIHLTVAEGRHTAHEEGRERERATSEEAKVQHALSAHAPNFDTYTVTPVTFGSPDCGESTKARTKTGPFARAY